MALFIKTRIILEVKIVKRWPKDHTKTLMNWLNGDVHNRDVVVKATGRSWSAIEQKIRRMGFAVPSLREQRGDDLGMDIEAELNAEVQLLREQVAELTRRQEAPPIHNFYDRVVRFGVVSDTQMGSLYFRPDILEMAYRVFEEEGIKYVYHPGDLVDGENVYKGHVYELAVHGADAQGDFCINEYPKHEGITTYFITGNHDLSFWVNAGVDIGRRISEQRPDMVYLGRDEQDVLIGRDERVARMRLFHPGGGTAYALSYHPQKLIESLSGGQKPEVILFGHYHKAEMLPSYRNICAIQCGTTQSQTPFMRRKKLAAHMGFWIIEFTVNRPYLISRFKAEFFAVFEEKKAIKINI